MPHALHSPTARYSDAEWRTRVDLAAVFRLLDHYGMTDSIYTHATARVAGEPDCFLINPYDCMFAEVTASNLVKMNLAGELIDGAHVNPAGYTIHSAILGARADVQCVIHTHTEAGVAVSCLEDGLLPLNQWALQFYKRVARHPYEGIALDLDERQRLVASLGRHQVLLLDNHGLATAGRSVAEAFKLIHNLERACRAQLQILACGRAILPLDPAVCEKTARQYQDGMDALLDQPAEQDLEWQALLRLAQRVHHGFDR